MARGTKQSYKGIKFASGFEANVAEQLDNLKVRWEYERTSFDYYLPITTGMCRDCGSSHVVGKRLYTPDFYLPDVDAFIEVKGHFKPHDRKIIPIIKKTHYIDIRLLFLYDNKVTRNSVARYSDWCEQRSIPCAIKEVPERWVKHDSSDVE